MSLGYDTYLQTLMDLYLCLPDTPRRSSRTDINLVRQLWDREIPLATVETALLLATVRRGARPDSAPPLGPIRSFHYFRPVIEELLENPVAESYRAYLRSKVVLRPTHSNPPTTTGGVPGKAGTIPG
jgi:hypothetical protein